MNEMYHTIEQLCDLLERAIEAIKDQTIKDALLEEFDKVMGVEND